MRGKPVTCCFSGHRPSKLPWGTNENDPRCVALKEHLYELVRDAYREGYRHFICGMARGSDFFFCEAVLRLREEAEGVTLEAAIPFQGQQERWCRADQARYEALVAACDQETLIQETYDSGCMLRRNRYMVDHSSLLIAVHDGHPGGTRYTISYALQRGLTILDLSPDTQNVMQLSGAPAEEE